MRHATARLFRSLWYTPRFLNGEPSDEPRLCHHKPGRLERRCAERGRPGRVCLGPRHAGVGKLGHPGRVAEHAAGGPDGTGRDRAGLRHGICLVLDGAARASRGSTCRPTSWRRRGGWRTNTAWTSPSSKATPRPRGWRMRLSISRSPNTVRQSGARPTSGCARPGAFCAPAGGWCFSAITRWC